MIQEREIELPADAKAGAGYPFRLQGFRGEADHHFPFSPVHWFEIDTLSTDSIDPLRILIKNLVDNF